MLRPALGLVLALCLPVSTHARPVDRSGELLRFEQMSMPGETDHPLPPGVFSAAVGGTTYFGGTYWNADSTRWEAIEDSVWTFDSGVGSHFDHSAAHVYPFKDPSLHAYMEGWVGIDQSFSDLPFFRRLGQAAFAGSDTSVGAGAGLGGEYSFWAGVLPAEADSLCFAEGQGYGDAWALCIEHAEVYSGSGTVTWSYSYANETEAGFDYSYAIVDTTGNNDRVTLATYTGLV